MKTIGRTKENNVIVEMSQKEYRSFIELEIAVGNRHSFDRFIMGNEELDGVDLSNSLDAIRQLYSSRENINLLKRHVDEIDRVFGEIKEKQNA